MNVVPMANAIVHFYLLRKLGHFTPEQGGRFFRYRPCMCGRKLKRSFSDGLPETLAEVTFHDLVHQHPAELGVLCRAYFGCDLSKK